MNKIIVNGEVIFIKPTISRFQKSAYKISQEIFRDLGRIGITPEYIDLPFSRNPFKRGEPAQISWIVNGKDYYFQCNTQERYVDNLGVIGKVIEQESYAIRNGLKEFAQVMNQFRIGYNEDGEKTKTAREIIGVEPQCKDLDYIRFKYKKKAKELHPDIGGDAEEFKKLNEALSELEKELQPWVVIGDKNGEKISNNK